MSTIQQLNAFYEAAGYSGTEQVEAVSADIERLKVNMIQVNIEVYGEKSQIAAETRQAIEEGVFESFVDERDLSTLFIWGNSPEGWDYWNDRDVQ